MKVSDLKQSRYLAKEDCMRDGRPYPLLATIDHMNQEDVSMEGEPRKMRWVMFFREPHIKPMVLNPTNGTIIEQITGSDDSDHWTGKQIVLYNDPDVSFGGKRVGGVRVRAPRFEKMVNPQAGQTPPPRQPPPQMYPQTDPRYVQRPQQQPPPAEFDDTLDRMYGPGDSATGRGDPDLDPDDDIPY